MSNFITNGRTDNLNAGAGELEREIDGMVYELYGLGEEIEIVENSD